MSKKLLFISHDATRTGAPILLLNLLRWLKTNTDISITILLKDSGVLKKEFEEIGDTHIWNNVNKYEKISTWIKRKVFKKVKGMDRHKQRILTKLIKKDFDLIYANSIATCETIIEFEHRLNCPIICHVHELEMGLKEFCGLEVFKKASKYFDGFIAVSKAVKINLIKNHQINRQKIDLVHGFIPTIDTPTVPAVAKHILRKELNLPEDTFVVGASGTTDWRKAPDLFIQLAYETQKIDKGNNIVFCWIGGDNNGLVYEKLMYDVDKLNLNCKVFFLGEKANSLDYFNSFDVFSLTSREDPFPLVCLEAASLGKPILCFNGAGGTPEFVENDCGFIVPYLDIEVMADKVILLAKDRDLNKKLGASAAEKVLERHCISTIAPKILQVIDRFL